MPEFSGYTAGVPCWVDLGTPDVDPSVSFYGELFGWEADDLGEEARGPGRAPRQPGGPVRRRRGPAGRAVLGDHVGDLDWIARPHGVTVSTRAFHARSAGSIPAGGTRAVALPDARVIERAGLRARHRADDRIAEHVHRGCGASALHVMTLSPALVRGEGAATRRGVRLAVPPGLAWPGPC